MIIFNYPFLKYLFFRLIHLYKKGITTLLEGKLYLKLQDLHDEHRKSLKAFRSNPQYNWKNNKQANMAFASKFKQRRAGFAPIDIIGMPGYCKLTEKEKDLCRNVRLIPDSFLQLRDILVAEQRRNGFVKLQTARRLLKIDVNKTRKLYDFLIEEGYVTKGQ